VLVNGIFVVSKINAEGLIVCDERFYPLDLAFQFSKGIVRGLRSLLKLLTVQGTNAGEVAFDYIAFHGFRSI